MKKYLSLIKIILISLILSIGIKYALAVSRPATVPNSNPDMIDTGNVHNFTQSKLKIGSNWLSSSDPNYTFEQSFNLVVDGTIFSSTGIATSGNFSVGSIDSGLTGTGNTSLCADTNGNLKRC